MRRAGFAIAVVLGSVAIAPDVQADEHHAAIFDQVFASEAGHWDGACSERVSADAPFRTIGAVFDITRDDRRGHRFEGRYGDQAVRGSTQIEGDVRVDRVDGQVPSRARITAVRFDGRDDYRYSVVEGQARSTVTRVGDLQTLLVEALDTDPPHALRLCTYRRTSSPDS